MSGTSRQFISIGIVFLLLGIVIGLFMAMSGNHGQIPTHAHVMLAGWASSVLFGLVYQHYPAVAARWPARVHLVAHLVGLLAMSFGLARIYGGDIAGGEPFAAVGSLLFAAGALVFALTILLAMWRPAAA